MTPPRRIHYLDGGGGPLAEWARYQVACGRMVFIIPSAAKVRITVDPKKVTCRQCRRWVAKAEEKKPRA